MKKVSDCKTIHFPSEDKIQKVHYMVAWSYAYREARKGQWIQYAIDHHRFKRRIQACETIITPILSHEHREKIYRVIKKDNPQIE